MSSVSSEELRILSTVYSLIKARAFALGIPEHVLAKHFRGAKDVLRRIEKFEVREGYVYAKILTSEAVRHGKPRIVRVKTLTGEENVVSVGTPLDMAYHYVTVSENTMKCTCPAALRTASKADKWLESLLKERGIQHTPHLSLFARHVLCKHTEAVLSKAIATGALAVTDKLIDNITLGVIAVAASEGVVTQQMIEEVLRIILSKG